jgi:SPX domain protein involved in polyphosphate accumulation
MLCHGILYPGPALQVRDFIQAQGSSLQADLQALAAAAPHLALQDSQQLEWQANELGRQLLALETYMQLNQTGFVKICKKHDKVCHTECQFGCDAVT